MMKWKEPIENYNPTGWSVIEFAERASASCAGVAHLGHADPGWPAMTPPAPVLQSDRCMQSGTVRCTRRRAMSSGRRVSVALLLPGMEPAPSLRTEHGFPLSDRALQMNRQHRYGISFSPFSG